MLILFVEPRRLATEATELEQWVIIQELIDMLISWNHNSGFDVHVRGQIDGDARRSYPISR